MGLGEKKANYNEVVEISELVKKRRAENVKERAAVMNRMKEWQKSKLKPPAPVKIHRGGEQLNKVTDLVIDRFGVTIGGKELVQDTTLKVVGDFCFAINTLGLASTLGRIRQVCRS